MASIFKALRLHRNSIRSGSVGSGVIRARVLRSVFVLAVLPAAALTGCGSDDEGGSSSAAVLLPADVTQTVEFTATEYAFGADASTTIEAGEVVRFRLTNVGELDHEMRVLDDTGRLIDQIPRLAPGATGEVLLRFDKAGQYQLICDIDDHLTLGQRAIFSVND